MKTRPVATAVAIASGLIVLLGAFIPLPLFAAIRLQLVQWAVIVAGAAVLVGIGNLFYVHFLKVRRREKGSMYSLLLLVSMLATLFVGLFEAIFANPSQPVLQDAVNAIIFPVEASLMALLAVTLVYASIRVLRRRADFMTLIFLATALIALGGSVILPLILPPDFSAAIQSWLSLTVVSGGTRGLLLGVALGALTTGLRVLFAVDRPYGGK